MSAVAEQFKPGGNAEQLGKLIAKELIHRGIPQATAAICGALAETVFPMAGPIGAQLGSQAGEQLGDLISKEVSKETGYGLPSSRSIRVP